MRTYDRETYVKAQQAWADIRLVGWERIREAAAKSGMLFPPKGTRWDSWNDPQPSQVAKVEQARQENEPELLRIIRRSRSWNQVVGAVMAFEDHTRELAWIRTEDDEYEAMAEKRRRYGDPMALGHIIVRVAESMGVDLEKPR
jgi:hypothetical protein